MLVLTLPNEEVKQAVKPGPAAHRSFQTSKTPVLQLVWEKGQQSMRVYTEIMEVDGTISVLVFG